MNGSGLLIFAVVAFALMFLMTIPQRRMAKRHRELMSQIKAGDEVVTMGGIYGTITEVEDDDTVLLEISEDTDIRVARASISRVVTRTEPVASTADTDAPRTDLPAE